ncbi:hypothetical protein CA13_60030 [Planctomycetes bacterium CA13]|uniref:DUF4350 domain-containing protein n=1 Tax=Novipirellula herctigrandis TaxID=2527986 RepID=A0A5C5ZB42_9BACT|nr:hypothetical protein CA13_60030 [Planctomycetes bacterium CA13]
MKKTASNRFRLSRGACAILVFAMVLSVGCGQLSSDYGQSSGRTAQQSLNGFGALRNAFTNAGVYDRDIRRLTDRVERCDTIVWTPEYATPINYEVTDWFDSWLRRGERTLVYVIPDSGSEVDYWNEAMKIAPPEKRVEFRRRAGRSINQRIQWRLNRLPIKTNGWFELEPKMAQQKIGKTQGVWADRVKPSDGHSTELSLEYALNPYESDKSATKTSTTNTTTTAANTNTNNATVNTGPTGPGSPNWVFIGTATVTTTPVEFESLLKDSSGETIVARIHSDKWRGSQMIVVAGGSLLTNFALAKPFSVALADKIVRVSVPGVPQEVTAEKLLDAEASVATQFVSQPKVGFISSPSSDLPVSESDPSIPKASGMELLTVWPICLVTIHSVLLGLIVCLMLLPSLGRPKRIRYNNVSNFGDHLDAVAALMNRAKGEAYARNRISEYLKRVNGETNGPWIQPDTAHQPTSTTKPHDKASS